MRHIITIILCIIVMLCAMFFQVVEVDDILNFYTSTVESLGSRQLTSKLNMIGERYDKIDDYTGSYKCSAENVTGRDVIYGGCSVDRIKLNLKGKADTQSGELKIRIRLGYGVEYITINDDGTFDELLEFDGGGNYIIIEYEDFTGEIDVSTEYAE
ncbi:MAG: hypothetical protein K2H13_03235 [Eubacterium sp.]|nr:hypothetical protein [Eubacterium sp.]MDE6154830.1 hypothetical protein [Eubacterium sp.]